MAWQCGKCGKCGREGEPDPPGIIGFVIINGCRWCESVLKIKEDKPMEKITLRGKIENFINKDVARANLWDAIRLVCDEVDGMRKDSVDVPVSRKELSVEEINDILEEANKKWYTIETNKTRLRFFSESVHTAVYPTGK